DVLGAQGRAQRPAGLEPDPAQQRHPVPDLLQPSVSTLNRAATREDPDATARGLRPMRTPRTRNAEAMSRIARTLLRVAMIVTPLFAMAVALRAGPREDGKSRADEFLAFARREAASHTMRHGSDGRPLVLRAEPVLKWSNPLVGEIYGEVFVWTSMGRPDVVWS